jgi:hypothetical protein
MNNTEKWVIQNTHGQLLQSFAIDPEKIRIDWYRPDAPGKTKAGQKGPLNLRAESKAQVLLMALVSQVPADFAGAKVITLAQALTLAAPMSNAFKFNPFWPTRTDPVFVVRTLEQSAGTNLDTDQRFAICAVLDGLPVGASMRDFVVAMKARDVVALGITPEQYTALEPIFETMRTWQ